MGFILVNTPTPQKIVGTERVRNTVRYFDELLYCRQQGFGGGYDDRGVPSRGPNDSDSDSELDIEVGALTLIILG